MKNTITISKDNHKIEVSIFDGISIREVPVKVKTDKGWTTEYKDIRELKIGAELDGGIVIENPYL